MGEANRADACVPNRVRCDLNVAVAARSPSWGPHCVRRDCPLSSAAYGVIPMSSGTPASSSAASLALSAAAPAAAVGPVDMAGGAPVVEVAAPMAGVAPFPGKPPVSDPPLGACWVAAVVSGAPAAIEAAVAGAAAPAAAAPRALGVPGRLLESALGGSRPGPTQALSVTRLKAQQAAPRSRRTGVRSVGLVLTVPR